MTPEELRAAGAQLRKAGLDHLIPVGEDKRPVIRWRNGGKDYATEKATAEELDQWADDPKVHGLAAVANAETGLVVLDVEPAGMDLPLICEALRYLPPQCLRESVNGGMHAYLRIDEGEYPHGLGRLAYKATDNGPVLLAEVRTAPNYAVVVGPGRPPLADDFGVADGDRDTFDHLFRQIQEAGDYVPEPPPSREYVRTGTGGGTGAILGDALASGALSPLALLPEGWEVTGHDRHGRTFVVRPEAESQTSGNARGGVVVIHSAAVDWAETGRGYSAAETLARARFGGDYAAAMRWVEDQARALADDGQAPPDHWPAEVLHAVHQARQERAGQGQKEAPAGESLGFVDWGRFWTEETPEVEYLIPGLLLKGTACAIHSKAGAGKSLLSLELAVNLATGGVALGEPVDPVTVLYVDLEQDRGLVRERLESLGLDGSSDLSRLHYSLLGDWPPLDTDNGGRLLRDTAVRLGADLVVIDTTSRVIEGEENSADTFHNLYRHTGRRLKAAGIAVLRLDHSGKDEKKGQRGSSAKDSDVDVIYALSVAGGDLVNLRRTKNRPNLEGPELLQLRRLDGPLRHVPVTVNQAAEAKVEAVVTALDNAGAPPDCGRDRAVQILKTAGVKARTEHVATAVRRRKLAARTDGEQVGNRGAGPWIQCRECDRYTPPEEQAPDGITCTRCRSAVYDKPAARRTPGTQPTQEVTTQ